MATASDIVSGALKLLGVRAAESPIEDNEAQDGLVALNDMMAEWQIRNLCIGFEEVTDINDEIYVDAGTEGAIKANLAVWMAPEYNRPVSFDLQRRADRGITSIYGAVIDFSTEFPDSLPIGSGNESSNYQTDGDVPNSRSHHFYPPNSKNSCG